MAAPAHILHWMAGRLDGCDAEAVAREVVLLLLEDPGVTDARVFVSNRQVAGSPESVEPSDGTTIEEGATRVVIGGEPSEDTQLAAFAGAICVDRATSSGRHEARRQLIHDLRGSLAVIAGHCEMLEAAVWGAMTPEQLRSIKAVARQSERMRDILDELRRAP